MNKFMTDYTFPFSTCEIPYQTSTKIAQPYSFIINLVSTIILVYALLTSKNLYIQLFFGILILFEGFHTYSHYKHLDGDIQTKIIHILAYLANIFYLMIFINITKIIPPLEIFLLYGFVIVLDLIFFIKKIFIGYFIAQLILIIITNLYFYKYVMNRLPYYYIHIFMVLMILLIILFLNEMYHCKNMLLHYKFPYHAIIETVGVLIFVLYVFILKALDQ